MLHAQQSAEPYPLAIGNYWVYQGHDSEPAVSDAQGRLLPPQTKRTSLRCKIVEVVQRKGSGPQSPPMTAARFDNFPLRSGEIILLTVNSKQLYVVDYREPSDALRILRRVQNPRDDLADLLRATPLVSMPLVPGKIWGPHVEEWSVVRRAHSLLRGVSGAEAAANLDGFILASGDNTHNIRVDFVPGIGITHVFSASLFQAGDPNHWEVESQLVEVYLH